METGEQRKQGEKEEDHENIDTEREQGVRKAEKRPY